MELKGKLEITGIFCGVVLLAIWPLPYTISARNLALLVGAICFAASCIIQSSPLSRRQHLSAWLLPACFFAWMAIRFSLSQENLDEQWADIRSVWVRVFCALCVGSVFGICAKPITSSSQVRVKNLPLLFAVAVGATSLIYACHYLEPALQGHTPSESEIFLSLYEGKTAVVVYANLCLVTLLAVFFNSEAPIKNRLKMLFGTLTATACLFALFYSNTKNGLLICLILFFSSFLLLTKLRLRLLSIAHRKDVQIACVAIFFLSAWLIQLHLKNAPEWRTVLADVEVGIQIDKSSHWKDPVRFPTPINHLGAPVADSAYSRAAWATAALHLLRQYPMGYGVLEQSFGALARQEWADFHPPNGKTRGSTHSGWLDFGLATGIPGLFILFVWMLRCWKRGLQQRGVWADIVKLALPAIFLTYLFAEVCTDHFIELLFFLLALFTYVTQPDPTS